MSTPTKTTLPKPTAVACTPVADERFSEENIARIETQLLPALGQFGLGLAPNEFAALVRAHAEGSTRAVDVVCRIVGYRLHAAFKDVQQERLDEELGPESDDTAF